MEQICRLDPESPALNPGGITRGKVCMKKALCGKCCIFWIMTEPLMAEMVQMNFSVEFCSLSPFDMLKKSSVIPKIMKKQNMSTGEHVKAMWFLAT